MKNKMDIEDLFKEEFANQKVAPASKSFTQLRLRHIAKKLGLYVLSGSMVIALGVAGTIYFNQADESISSVAIANDTPSFSVNNTEQTKNPVDIQTSSKFKVNETLEELSYQGTKKEQIVVEKRENSTVIIVNQGSKQEEKLSEKDNRTSAPKKAKTPIFKQENLKNTQAQLIPTINANKADASASIKDSKTTEQKETVAEQKDENSTNVITEESQEEAVSESTNSDKLTAVKGKQVASSSKPQNNEKTIISSNEVQKEIVTLINEQKKIDSLPVQAGAINEKSSNKRKRKFKFTVGALYNHQIGTNMPYEYNGFYSFTAQAGIKYPLFKKKVQVVSGLDYTASHHYLFSNGYREGIYDEVNEIHALVRRLEIPLAIDYKLPISTPVEFRLGVGLKFSKIFTDDEEAYNIEGNLVVHPDGNSSFLVDELDPVNTYKFVYLNVSKDIKNARLNFQCFYYFTNYPMELYSQTFVSDYFNTRSVRLGLSIDF